MEVQEFIEVVDEVVNEEAYEQYLDIKERLFQVFVTVDRSMEEPLGKSSAIKVFVEEFKEFFANLKGILSHVQIIEIANALPKHKEAVAEYDTQLVLGLVPVESISPVNQVLESILRLERHLKARPISRAPLYRAQDMLNRFDHYAEVLMNNEDRLTKKLKKSGEFKEELDRIADMYLGAKGEARHASNNLKDFLAKEETNEESTHGIIAKIEEKMGLIDAKAKLSGLIAEKERFLEKLKAKSTEYYDYRIQLGDFNYGRRLPGTEKCRLRRIKEFPNQNIIFELVINFVATMEWLLLFWRVA